MRIYPVVAAGLLTLNWGDPALADEIWLGAYRHDVAPFTHEYESGADIKAGWRGNPIKDLHVIGEPSPYALASANLQGGTDYAAVGLSWHLGTRIYARPGIGIAIHDGPSLKVRRGRRVDLGSRVLFEPELAVGWRIASTFNLEISWIHLSHARLFSGQNPGLNSLGLRAVYHLP